MLCGLGSWLFCFFRSFLPFTLYFYLHCAQCWRWRRRRRWSWQRCYGIAFYYSVARSHEEFSPLPASDFVFYFSFYFSSVSPYAAFPSGGPECVFWFFDFRFFRGFYFDSTTSNIGAGRRASALCPLLSFFIIFQLMAFIAYFSATLQSLESFDRFFSQPTRTGRVRNANEAPSHTQKDNKKGQIDELNWTANSLQTPPRNCIWNFFWLDGKWTRLNMLQS